MNNAAEAVQEPSPPWGRLRELAEAGHQVTAKAAGTVMEQVKEQQGRERRGPSTRSYTLCMSCPHSALTSLPSFSGREASQTFPDPP